MVWGSLLQKKGGVWTFNPALARREEPLAWPGCEESQDSRAVWPGAT